MKCEEVVLLLSEKLAGELAPARAAAVEAHLAGCRACADELASLASLTAALKAAPPPLPRSMAFEMMGDRVWAELAAKRRRRVTLLGLLGLAAAAAAALFLLWPRPAAITVGAPAPAAPDRSEIADADHETPDGGFAAPADGGADLLEALEGLDDEAAAKLSATLSGEDAEDAAERPVFGDDSQRLFDELDSLSPAEAERLDALLSAAAKKG
jgi:hypothetical protein